MNKKTAFVEAGETCLSLKLLQFQLNAAWYKDDLDGVSDKKTHNEKEYNKLKQVGDRVMGILTLNYNNVHGYGYERFTKMRTGPNPLDLLL